MTDPFKQFLNLLPATASLTVILIAGAALVGWALDLSSLTSLLPGLPAMSVSAALAFLLAALGLWLLQGAPPRNAFAALRRHAARLAATGTAALGLITLLEYAAGFDTGLSAGLAAALTGDSEAWLLRPSPQAAVGFGLVGLALLGLSRAQGVAAAQLLACAVILLTLAVLVVYLYDTHSLHQISPLIGVSLPATLGFLLLGIGILSTRPDYGLLPNITDDAAGSHLLRRLSPAVVLLPLVIGWLTLQGIDAGLYDTRFGIALFAVASICALTVLALYLGIRLNREEKRKLAEEFHRHVLELAPEGIAVTDLEGRIVLASARMEELFGYTPGELLGRPIESLWPPGHYPAHLAAELDHQGTALALNARHRDGNEFPAELTLKPVTIGGDLLLTNTVRDVTERTQAEQKIARLKNLYAALSQTGQAIVRLQERTELFQRICDIAIEYGQFKIAWIGLLEGQQIIPVAHSGPARKDLEQRPIPIDPQQPEGHSVVARAVRQGSCYVSNDYLQDPDTRLWHGAARELRFGSMAAFALRLEDRVVGVFTVYARETNFFDDPLVDLLLEMSREISYALDNLARETRRQEAEERIRYLGYHDPLTGLPNRNLLEDRLQQSLALAQRHARPVMLLFLDLDRFKPINDSFGHAVGDRLLQAVAERLRRCLRDSDTVSRRGGDEFLIVLPEVREPRDAARVAEKILDALARPYLLEGCELTITTSIGISVFPQDGQDMETLIKNADIAMYHAKESGRNCYQFFAQEMNATALDRLMMENQLRRGIERREFTLHFQPQVDIRTNRIVGAEALIRWQHPELGLLAPARFIPIAEESGLIVPIGEWVLNTACEQNRRWQDAGLTPLPVSVNLSAAQFRQQNLQQVVRRALVESRLEARFLELELTEGSVMQDAALAVGILGELKAMGLHLAIDDFGTGYSSLSYLRRFPLDRLKVDRSFVQDVTANPDDAEITRAIIGMAHSLRLRVIAEGVETEAQLAFLRAQRCDESQGYYFSRPVPAEDFVRFLRSR